MSHILCITPHAHWETEKLFSSITAKRAKAFSEMFDELQKPGASYEIENGVAEIRIEGPLMDGPCWYELFGVSSYERIRKQIYEANLDPNVTGIRLCVNSPGGTVSGCFETQKCLSSSEKPIVEAEVETICASAAYLLAATAQKITAGSHSTVGSIGCILTIHGDKGFLAKMGITRTTLVSSVSPNKNDDPEDTGDAGLMRLQEWVNSLGQVFAERVATLRHIPVETVLANYGKGGVFVGKSALAAGIIDSLNDMEEQMKAETTETTTVTTTETAPDAAPMDSTMEEASTDAPGVEGTDRVGKELDRLKAIDDLKITGHDDLVYKAKYAERVDANTLKAWVFDAERNKKAGRQQAFNASAAGQDKTVKAIAAASPQETAAIQENAQLVEMAKKEAKNRA